MAECKICGTETDNEVCEHCNRRTVGALMWLLRIGMPTLRQIAYRKANVSQRPARSGNKAFASTPLDIDARQAYLDAEKALQYAAGSIGVKPIGWDDQGNPRCLLDCAKCAARIIKAITDGHLSVTLLASLHETAMREREHVATHVEPEAERRIVGICPECEANYTEPAEQGGQQPRRTPIYAADGQKWAVCPYCVAFLDLNKVRANYLQPVGGLHITRTQGEAARWVRENTGVHVTGVDLKNWRRQGRMPSTRHVEGTYWAWNIRELLACAEARRKRKEHQ